MIILAIIRLILFAVVMTVYIITVLIISIFVGDKTKASTHLRRPTIKLFFLVLGIRMKRTGTLPTGTVLFIGNHISYIDPFALVYHILAWPVAKLEVASWPLIGYVCQISGVIFVKRRSADSLRTTRVAIAEALHRGDSVVVYPEGTTTEGKEMLPFRRGIFDLAVNNNIPVVPVTIKYEDERASFVRRHSFLPHFIKLFSLWSVRVHIHFDEKIEADDSKVLLEKARSIIESNYNKLSV